MIQIERHSSVLTQQPEETLVQLRTNLEEAREVIYDELACKEDEGLVANIEKTTQLLKKYEGISNTINQIKEAEERLKQKEKKQLIKETLAETNEYKNDTAQLITKLKKRQELYHQESQQLISLIELISLHTTTIKEMEVEIKQERLLQKMINNLKQMHAELKEQQDSNTMFRKIRLTSEKDNNEYILNQIHKDSDLQLRQLEDKNQTLEQRVRQVNAENQVLSKEYYQNLQEFNRQKIKSTLLAQPAKPKPKKKKVEDKPKRAEQKLPTRISAVEPIQTEVLVMASDSKLQLYVGVVLGFISMFLVLQLASKYYIG